MTTQTQALTITDTMQVGKTLAASGFFGDAKEATQAVAKILAGQELGLGPVASMTGIYIVKGRVTLSANVMATLIKRSGRYSYRIERLDDTGCVLVFIENGKDLTPKISFTSEDAKKAGLLAGDNWQKYPRNMYFARAMSNGAKWHCPDVFGQPIYTPDELGGTTTIVDVETGEIIETAQTTTPKPEAQPAAPSVHDGGNAELATELFADGDGEAENQQVTAQVLVALRGLNYPDPQYQLDAICTKKGKPWGSFTLADKRAALKALEAKLKANLDAVAAAQQ